MFLGASRAMFTGARGRFNHQMPVIQCTGSARAKLIRTMPETPAVRSPENSRFSGDERPRTPASSHVGAWILALTLALVPIAGIPGEWVLQDTLKSTLLAIGVLCAAIAYGWTSLRSTETARLRVHGLLLFPAVLCVYALASMAWSHSYLAGVEACRWAMLGLLLWVALQLMHKETIPVLLAGIHIGAVGASAWVAAQYWGNLDWFPQAAVPASTFANRNFFAEYLVCTLPFSSYLLVQLEAPRWRQLMALSLAFNMVALTMCGTRSALVAWCLVGPVLLFVLWRYRSALGVSGWSKGSRLSCLLVLVVSVLSLGTLPTQNPALLAEGFGAAPLERSVLRAGSMTKPSEYTAGSFSIRSSMWRSTARLMMANPWTGVGAGAWEVHIPLYQGWNNSLETDFYAHNEFLQLLGEYGLPVGGGTLAVLLAYLLLSTQRTWQLSVAGNAGLQGAVQAVALCSLLTLFMVSNAGFPWRLASTGALFMVALALLASSTTRQIGLFSKGTWRVGIGGLVVALLVCIWISTQAMRAEICIVRSVQILNLLVAKPNIPADQRASLQQEAFALLQEGVAINPHYRKLTALAAGQFAATGNLEAALWAQDSVAASRPYLPDVHANRVLLYSNLQKPAEAQAALEALQALQSDAPRTRALGILLLRRAGQDDQAAQQLRTYFAKGYVEYDLVRFALAIGLQNKDKALTVQAYRLWVQGWPGENNFQKDAAGFAPESWRAEMQVRK
ncbi:MAG: O-antigen ligase domain-containing protein [Betaproteobacteria bacterium]|nr:O-antigen ligase domain-containing protein [Betaproteobacteria bacterium]